jgi:two-component system cell cycle response regulator
MHSAIIVDDHPLSRQFMASMLSGQGYKPTVASTAAEALAACEIAIPEIWFIDWMMPGMTGIELVKTLRSLPGGDRPHVVMVTAKESAGDLVAAFEAGVDDFVSKPASTLSVFARLKAAKRLLAARLALSRRIADVEDLNTQLTAANERLERMATTDGLTGLLNRRAGDDRAREIWAGAERYDEPLSVAIIDIDRFKDLNDSHGHALGDNAIGKVASIIAREIRSVDVAVRYGGDEFLVLLPKARESEALAAVDRIRSAIERETTGVNGLQTQVTVSAGIAARLPSHASAADLIAAADAELYRAKSMGRNRVCNREAAVVS